MVNNCLSAVATFMRRKLNRNQGYDECSLPAYSMRHKPELSFYARNTCSQSSPSELQILSTIQTCAAIMKE